MKKFILLLIMAFMSVIILNASQVSYSKAENMARDFLTAYSHNSYNLDRGEAVYNERNLVAYVFQLEPQGFVAVSADDNVYPIIAYSFTNKLIFDDGNLILYMIKTDISNRIKYNPSDVIYKNREIWNNFTANKNRDYFQQWPAENSTSTGGWVEDRWHQSSPFNDFCPLDDNNLRSVVGCVATAMSMIIDFHKYIGNAHFTNADDYWSGYYDFKIDDSHAERDYPSFPELNNYLDELGNHYQNGIELTNQDKAALCFACGVSVEMSYSSDGSGAWTEDVASALRNKFGFISANYQDNYGSSFYNNLKNNMKAMKPAELTIHWADGSNGHAIICDGYNTDNYYHLNFGWGTSDNSCWYLLPNGMPSGYSVVDGAVLNIEGGDVPVQVTGSAFLDGATSEGVYITLDGPRFYEAYILDTSNYFEIPAVQTGTYVATAIKDNRVYYDRQIVNITQTNHTITFNLGNFEALTGTVTAPISPIGTKIDIYKDNQIVYSGVCNNADGSFSIPDVLPGNYIATASLPDNYFQTKSFEVTVDNQTVNFNLSDYDGDFCIGYHNYSTDKWSLAANYTLSCGIKLTSEEISDHINQPLAKVSFLAPVSSDQAQITVQLWEGNNLLAEREVTDFQEGEWVTQSLDRFVLLNPDKEYYVAYKITSQTSELAYLDNGPRVEGKGAFFHTTGWVQIPVTNFDKNFCIEGVFITQDYATISGNISTDDNYEHLEKGLVVTQNRYIAHTNTEGNYSLLVPEGTYNLTAILPDHETQTINSISVTNGDMVNNIDFVLNYQSSANEDVVQNQQVSIKVYPNPFSCSKSKSTISFDIKGITENSELCIFNLKGEKIKTFHTMKEGKIVWNINDETNLRITNGIYFYRLSTHNKMKSAGKFIILK